MSIIYIILPSHITVCCAAMSNRMLFPSGTATEENGMLKVNEFLQVIGHEDAIYAIGDCNNVKENKTGYQAIEQAKVLSKTLHSILNDGNPVAYKPGWI